MVGILPKEGNCYLRLENSVHIQAILAVERYLAVAPRAHALGIGLHNSVIFVSSSLFLRH
jgi:hypothetical protein